MAISPLQFTVRSRISEAAPTVIVQCVGSSSRVLENR